MAKASNIGAASACRSRAASGDDSTAARARFAAYQRRSVRRPDHRLHHRRRLHRDPRPELHRLSRPPSSAAFPNARQSAQRGGHPGLRRRNADCDPGRSCVGQRCVTVAPCNGGCPAGQVCDVDTERLFDSRRVCELSCDPGEILGRRRPRLHERPRLLRGRVRLRGLAVGARRPARLVCRPRRRRHAARRGRLRPGVTATSSSRATTTAGEHARLEPRLRRRFSGPPALSKAIRPAHAEVGRPRRARRRRTRFRSRSI